MDPVESSAVASTAGSERRVHKKKKRGWHKRLHARKTAAQGPAVQSGDKHGPQEIAAGREPCAALQPSSERPPQEAQQGWNKTDDGPNTLRFTCSQCQDGVEYVPKDLVRHSEDEHKGIPPVFPCHACPFSTRDFSYLQVHLLSHKDTLSGCSACNDNVQRTWPELSAHLMTRHRRDDQYSCEACQTFSTGDVGVFLEHMHAHHLGSEAANDDPSLHAKDRSKFGPKITTQTLHCQHCGYETSQESLFNKHINAVHPNGSQRKRKMEIKSLAMKPDDPSPKTKTRLTRSAVRQMCWLTPDCLSLPGREFLDKYCHLSDPQTTLEETQQFLMKSVAAETGDQKWTKALKTVWSNVPQDLNHLPKSENGVKSNPSDLAVLTVKNQISVAQNGATYGKKLRRVTSSDKDTFSHESAANDAGHAIDQNGCQSNLNDHATCPQTDTKSDNDVLFPAHNEPSECTQTQDNRENQEVRTGLGVKEPMHADGIELSSELKATNESEEPTSIQQVVPKRKRPKRRRKSRSKKADKRSAGLPLKIVLKKNPVKEQQWVSGSPSGGGLTSPRATAEEMAHILHDMLLPEAQQTTWTKASKTELHDPPQAIASIPQLEPGDMTPCCVPVGPESVDRDTPLRLPSPHPGAQGDAEKPLLLGQTEVGRSSSAGRNSSAADEPEVEVFPEVGPLQTSDGGMDGRLSDNEMTTSPEAHTVIMPGDERTSADSNLALFSVVGAEGTSGSEVPAASRPGLLSPPAVEDVQQDPSTPSGHQGRSAPKTLERTLKLVAINPRQLVKCPAGDQPVVVLNHPDADIPEVARIMEVVNRYRGEVQKVVLSRRTASALSATNDEVSMTSEPTDTGAQVESTGRGKNCVQERFMLKLKLRRLSRKKYEVVETVSPGRDAATRFPCWFCGRVFTSQQTWIVHRQRHLMEWK